MNFSVKFLFSKDKQNTMKKTFLFLLIISIPVILLLLSNSSGSVGGKSGSIGDDGHTCTDCHSGTATPMSNWISTNVPAEGYTPGQTYSITATGTHNGVVKFGFELTVEDSQGNKTGTLQITEPSRTKFTNSNHAVTHTTAGNVPFGNTNTWTMNWVAPSGIDGDIGIYAAFNAANGNGNNTGDVIYKSSIFISKFVPVPALTSIVPNAADQGDTVQVTITGSNTEFAGSPLVSISYSDNGFEIINATSVVVVNPTTIQAEFSIPADASVGFWDVHVDNLELEKAFSVNLVTGIASNSLPDVKIYPNPANGHFFIENAAGSEISVFNTKGELIETLKGNNEKQLVDVSRLSKGLYFVKIFADGQERTEKLLVN